MDVTVKHTRADLEGFAPRHDNLVGIDSDGCVFDTMEIKQKRCFHGLIIRHWALEPIAPALRDCAEFVNLYSQSRGQNRFVALLQTFELLATHPGARDRRDLHPRIEALRQFVAEGPLTADGLQRRAQAARDPELARLLAWNHDVNAAVAATVKGIPPFPWARRSLERLRATSDAICVSQTPTDALLREWADCGLDRLIDLIAGQELGTKAEHLARASRGRYAPHRVLMIGDALGDLRAAEATGACFYPILPGREDAAWQRFHAEAMDRFLDGSYAGPYQDARVREFLSLLPASPAWQTPN